MEIFKRKTIFFADRIYRPKQDKIQIRSVETLPILKMVRCPIDKIDDTSVCVVRIDFLEVRCLVIVWYRVRPNIWQSGIMIWLWYKPLSKFLFL